MRGSCEGVAPLMAVIPRACGVSSTPQLLDSIIRLWNTGSPAFAGDDGCFVAAFLAMTSSLRDLAARGARGVQENVRPLKSEGAGNAGCALHRPSRVQNCKKTHTSIQVQRRQSGIPRAMVLRLTSRSPR